MEKLISCDWGTSALRLRLVDTGNVSVLAEEVSSGGISVTFDLWKQSGKPEGERLSFYQSVLTGQIRKMEEQLDFSLQNVPLIISGMASSNMGMTELSYKEIPFSADGHDLYVRIIGATNDFKHTILVISGAKTTDDVMRGEETQLIGCLNADDKEDQLFIFPGTHSKHVSVRNGEVVDFKTCMTGEFFELLSKKSVLSHAVEATRNLSNTGNLKRFEQGVKDSLHVNLLQGSFLVRTNHLFAKLSKEENYCYLSGLLIGTELKELITIKMPLTVVSNELLARFYSAALQELDIKAKCQDAGKAIIGGHCKIYDLYRGKLTGGSHL